MRLAILSRAPDLYSTRRLVEAAEARGHEVQVLDTLRCTAHLTANGPEVHYHGERLDPPDAIIPRIGSSITFYGLSIVRQFEAMGVHHHGLTRWNITETRTIRTRLAATIMAMSLPRNRAVRYRRDRWQPCRLQEP